MEIVECSVYANIFEKQYEYWIEYRSPYEPWGDYLFGDDAPDGTDATRYSSTFPKPEAIGREQLAEAGKLFGMQSRQFDRGNHHGNNISKRFHCTLAPKVCWSIIKLLQYPQDVPQDVMKLKMGLITKRSCRSRSSMGGRINDQSSRPRWYTNGEW